MVAVRGVAAQGLLLTLDYLGESVRTMEEAAAATREYVARMREIDVEPTDFRPTALMERVSRHLEQQVAPLSRTRIVVPK
mgnify:CR=1 FL=1